MAVDLKPVLTPVRDLGEFIREQRVAAQISLRGLAAKAGVSNPYLSQVERGLRRPSADVLAHIAAGLSISVETLLTKAGVLPVTEASDVISAIRADHGLSERQKASLLDIYSAFRQETSLLAAAAEALAAESATQLAMESAKAPATDHLSVLQNQQDAPPVRREE